MTKKAVATEKAPKAIGPYSQGIQVGSLLFVSGQVALDPSTGQLVDGNVAVQTERVISNLKAVIEAAGSSLEKAVKTTVFLRSFSDFQAMNEVYARHFPAPFPARSTVEVSALPRGASVEIEAIVEL